MGKVRGREVRQGCDRSMTVMKRGMIGFMKCWVRSEAGVEHGLKTKGKTSHEYKNWSRKLIFRDKNTHFRGERG